MCSPVISDSPPPPLFSSVAEVAHILHKSGFLFVFKKVALIAQKAFHEIIDSKASTETLASYLLKAGVKSPANHLCLEPCKLQGCFCSGVHTQFYRGISSKRGGYRSKSNMSLSLWVGCLLDVHLICVQGCPYLVSPCGICLIQDFGFHDCGLIHVEQQLRLFSSSLKPLIHPVVFTIMGS